MRTILKWIKIFILIQSFYTLHALHENARRLILTIDWDKELMAEDLDNPYYVQGDESWGPITQRMITALAQQAAPILVTSTVWHNFVARRQLFKDFLEKKGNIYKDVYKRFQNNNTFNQFQSHVSAYAQGFTNIETDSYYLCYQTPFLEKDWIIKKVSNYIYLLIPVSYLNSLQSQALPTEKPNLLIPLSNNELHLGLRIDKLTTLSYRDALDPSKHALSLKNSNFAQLLKKKDAEEYTQIKSQFQGFPPEAAVLSKHFIKLLPEIFITAKDLIDKNKKVDATEKNRVNFLRTWHIYMDGHGSESPEQPLQQSNLTITEQPTNRGSLIYTSVSFEYLAGLELLAFREWLGFLNNNVKTEFLFYETCYSGGQHLQKLYEHQWDYSTGKRKKVEQKADTFNYMIVTGNLYYTTTQGASIGFIYVTTQQGRSLYIQYPSQFVPFFKACEKYFIIDKVAVGQKKLYFETRKKLQEAQQKVASITSKSYYLENLEKAQNIVTNLEKILDNLQFITLNGVIDYVHDVTKHQPAVRYPGTEWFVPLPINEEKQYEARIRFETYEQTQKRIQEEKQTKEMIEKQAKKLREQQKKGVPPIETQKPYKQPSTNQPTLAQKNLVSALKDLQQKLLLLKNRL